MGLSSQIEWTDASWNPWQGCTKVSEACAHCYMFSDLKRYGRDGSIVVKSKDPTFNLPLKRRRTGEYAIPPGSKVFTCSWSDWFHERADAWRPKAFSIIQQRPDVTFQIVTKRSERIAECLPPDWGDGYPNVWLITTVENQHWADLRIPQLLDVPAVVHGLSIEPLLAPLDVSHYLAPVFDEGLDLDSDEERRGFGLPHRWPGIQWIIAGGESGHHARPMHPDWVRSLRDQSVAAGVPFFFKQWGEWKPISEMPEAKWDPLYVSRRKAKSHEDQAALDDSYGRNCTVETGTIRYDGKYGVRGLDLFQAIDGHPGYQTFRVGKKAAGRELDGRTWDEFPQVEAAHA